MQKCDPFHKDHPTGNSPQEQQNLADAQKEIPLRDLVEAALIVSGLAAGLVLSVFLVSFLVK